MTSERPKPKPRPKSPSRPRKAAAPPAPEPAAAAALDPAPGTHPDATPAAPPAAEPAAHRDATPEPARRRRIVVTGAAGFVGSAVARRLHARGDQVVALVRDPARAGRIRDIAAEGLELVADDLSDVAGLTEVLRDADAVVHAAGSYRVGIRKSERGAMWDANVGTTTRILDAAEAARTPRVVYVSTCNVFGDTRGQVVDETFRRDLADGFLSWYDETKYGAHEVVEQRIAAGAPIVITLPSQVYGPGDQSSFGEQLRRAGEGTLRYRAVDDLGVGLVHVDDLASGIVAALDDGRVGASYVLSGPTVRLRDAISLAAAVGGRRPPRLAVPTALLRLIAPIGGLVGQPNLREVLAASAGVTYWASAARAERELGWRARDLETGFRELLGGPPTATD